MKEFLNSTKKNGRGETWTNKQTQNDLFKKLCQILASFRNKIDKITILREKKINYKTKSEQKKRSDYKFMNLVKR